MADPLTLTETLLFVLFGVMCLLGFFPKKRPVFSFLGGLGIVVLAFSVLVPGLAGVLVVLLGMGVMGAGVFGSGALG